MLMLILIIACLFAAYWLLARPIPKNMRVGENRINLPDEKANTFENQIKFINAAIASNRDVHFQYEKKDGSVTRRIVTPRELRRLSVSELRNLMGGSVEIRKEGRLCMFGYCHLRDADRVFAINRIQNIRFE
jgi:predicted DNA-binding transcriptional regulator YafY